MERLEERYLLAADSLQLSAALLDDLSAAAAGASSGSALLRVTPALDPLIARETLSGGGSAVVPPTIPLSETFFLHSNPGATKTIYLDFDGYTIRNTIWNSDYSIPNIVQPAFTLDADVLFSDAELITIQGIWEHVSEDFIPFDVNVTTQDPGVDALQNTGDPDTEWGMRVVVGGSTNDWFTPTDGRVVGGVAYLTSFNWDVDTPALAFSADFGGSTKSIAEVVSHEVGHTLGLDHDGQYRFFFDIRDPDPTKWDWVRVPIEYYKGHQDPPTGAPTGWAPIMGNGYSQNLTQWGKGEYYNANNIEDDLHIITSQNGFDYRPDDHGSDIATASLLQADAAETTYSAEGIIEQNTDVDYFSFIVEGLGEVVSFDIDPYHRGPNLDILATLYSSSGAVIATSNPLDDIYAGGQGYGALSDGGWLIDPVNMVYTDEFVLRPGTYYVAIEGTGRPITYIDPAAHPGPPPVTTPPTPPGPNDPATPDASDWGYTDYGSLGQYTITGVRKKGLVVGVDFDALGASSPANWAAFAGGATGTVLTNLRTEAGVITPYSLEIKNVTPGSVLESFPSENPVNTADLPNHALPLGSQPGPPATNGLGGYVAWGGDTWSFVWGNLEPGAVYQVYVFGHADIPISNVVEIVGGEWNGEVQTFNFTQVVAPDGLAVNDDLSPGGDELTALPILVVAEDILDEEGLSTGVGQITINVSNEVGFAAGLAGLAIAPTKVGSISGQKWNDEDGDRVRDVGEEGLEDWVIYLDLNNNGKLDLISTPEEPVTVDAPQVPQDILDNNVVKNELDFELAGEIVDVDVTLDITHEYNGDLDVYLISPAGTRVKLFSDVGTSSENFTDTTFDDEALTAITDGTAPFTGTFRPEAHISASELSQFPLAAKVLSAFDGEDAEGLWTLEIGDDANDDIGVLNSWSITVTLSGFDVYLERFTETDANGFYFFPNVQPGLYHVREHFQEQQTLDGWRQTWSPPPVTVASGGNRTGINFGNWIPAASQQGSIAGQKWNDANGDGVKDANESGLGGWDIYIDLDNDGVLDPTSDPVTIQTTDVPKPIHEDLPPATSQIPVDIVGTIREIEVTLDITHSFMGDLDAHLTSPSNRTFELFSDVGEQFNNFFNLVIADDADESIASIGKGNPPKGYDLGAGYFTGAWRPEQGSLSNFFLGENPNGVWTLTIQDNDDADQGTLNSWSLKITAGEPVKTTDSDGKYLFENLPEGQYIVREEQKAGWQQIPPADTDIPSATWENSGWTVTVSLDAPSGPFVTDVDFGNRSTAGALPGDYNGNGRVDPADYVLWRKSLATNVDPPSSGADGNGSGTVDPDDYGVWTANYGKTSSGAGGAAAEQGAEPAPGGEPAVESDSAFLAPSAPLSQVSSTEFVTADAQGTSFVAAATNTPASAVQAVAAESFLLAPSPAPTGSSRNDTVAVRLAHSNETSDAALVAWLASLTVAEQDGDEGKTIEADYEPWHDDSFDELDPIDSVFEVLGVGAA